MAANTQTEPMLETNEIVERVRAVVQQLLRDGSEPPAISFVLAFVATELGLSVAPNPIDVFPVVLDGVARAAAKSKQAQSDDGPEIQQGISEVLGNPTVH